MVNREELIGTTEYLTLYESCRINRCRYNRVRLYFRMIHVKRTAFLKRTRVCIETSAYIILNSILLRYCDYLRVGQAGVRNPVGAFYSQ